MSGYLLEPGLPSVLETIAVSGSPGDDLDEMSTIRRILVPTDFSEQSYSAFGYARSLARDLSAELILLHVIDSRSGYSIPPELSLYLPEPAEIRRYVEGQLEGLVVEARKLVKARSIVVEGRAAAEILRVAKTQRPDLIVMGAQGANSLVEAIFGGTVTKVLHGATCPVLVHRESGGAAGGRGRRRVHDATLAPS